MVEEGDYFGEALKIERVLGRGGTGTVYLATDVWLGRKAAVKVLSGPAARDPLMIQRFKREARALAKVRSEHVARAYAMGSCPEPDSCWLAMEYVEGASLGAIINEHRTHSTVVPIHRSLSILRQIALGLSAVHQAQLVHRDVKPHNIVIEEHTGRPVLVDFGLAIEEGDRTGADAAGTASYMSPEQAGLSIDTILTKRSDIYALGCTAFELLTGRVPFVGRNPLETVMKHALEEAPRLSATREHLEALDELIAKTLEKDPSARLATCDAVVLAIDAVLASIDERPTALPPASLPTQLHDAIPILVVDDDPAFRKLVIKVLEAHYEKNIGPEVHLVEADSGHAALELTRLLRPEIILLDFDMPGLDGIETLTRLRRSGCEARVLVISSRIGEKERWRFSVLGVSDFISKPATPEQLLSAVARVVVKP